MASIFRNYLLATRIFRTLGVTPVSIPELPASIATHPLWLSWDLTVEQCLSRVQELHAPTMFRRRNLAASAQSRDQGSKRLSGGLVLPGSNFSDDGRDDDTVLNANGDRNHRSSAMLAMAALARIEAKKPASTFFADQLTAFEIWLEHGPPAQRAPLQLCIVLQVLLSQLHRLRALKLLAEFLDLGTWATDMSLSVGIHAYVQKLLVSQTPDLQPVLTFIWSKVLHFDPSCCKQLLQKHGHE